MIGDHSDNLVRLILAVSAIVVITAVLYGFGAPEAVAIEPSKIISTK